jgi:hypothetical protein
VAKLTLRQMEKDALSNTTDGALVVFDEEDPEF